MKGNQGLEALAALCGGVAKVEAPSANPAPLEQARMVPAAPAYTTGPGNDGGAIRSPAQPHPAPVTNQQQQWAHQAMAAAASTLANSPAAAVGAILQALQSQQAQAPAPPDASSSTAAQQLAYFHYIQAHAVAAAQAAQHAPAPSQSSNPLADPNTAVALALAAQHQGQTQAGPAATHQSQHVSQSHQRQVLPSPAGSPTQAGRHGSNNMQPPPPQLPTIPSNSVGEGRNKHTPVAPSPPTPATKAPTPSNVLPIAAASPAVQPTTSQSTQQPLARRPSSDSESIMAATSVMGEDKKLLKRAANRRSAQLSRKRKKQFIEELKEENDKLRRKEQILRSIPDLIVVFDSAGRLWFVSHSVKRFLNFSPADLEGCSFWDRLCDESVRLLKAAFMDALAARSKDSDTVPLGSGVWELRLVDKDGSHKLVTLNGVVHFSGEAPECVCSIRPREICENHLRPLQEPPEKTRMTTSAGAGDTATVSSKASSISDVHFQPNLVRAAIKPQQSVISNGSSDDTSVKNSRSMAPQGVAAEGGAQISDNESTVSE